MLLFKWQITVTILVLLSDYPNLQIISLIFLQYMVTICLFMMRPYADRDEMRMTFFNEYLSKIDNSGQYKRRLASI